MSVRQEEFGALRLQATLEEVGAELQGVLRLMLEDFAIERADLVGVVAGQRHSSWHAMMQADTGERYSSELLSQATSRH